MAFYNKHPIPQNIVFSSEYENESRRILEALEKVKNKKIEVAKDLLKFSDYSMIEIANHLSFSSQSHFIQQFKEVVGITPKKYRDTHHNVKWNEKIWSEGDKANSSSEAM